MSLYRIQSCLELSSVEFIWYIVVKKLEWLFPPTTKRN